MPPRVAYLPDSFHEVNGVAHTSRNFVAFAERHALPFLCVRAGRRPKEFERRGELHTLELRRSPVSVPMERDLEFDPIFFRYGALIERTLLAFQPDVIHITGPSELGMFGAYFAWKQRVPLAASWHTNVHEYAGRRVQWLSRRFGQNRQHIEDAVEGVTLDALSRFYKLAQVLYAPNTALCDLLQAKTGRPCHLMERGVDTNLFTPARRTRGCDGKLVLGFVGRLSVEKNVRLLPEVDRELRERGLDPQWLIVGHGSEQEELRRELGSAARFEGVLHGEALATAYANMDLLVFPSHTDTFGNVVLEALASGVPAIVTPDGGPAHIVHEGETGRIAPDQGFADAIAELAAGPETLAAMRIRAREYALGCSWDAVFERVYAAYPSRRGQAPSF
ncbi:MAG TPA: glycosyltransferase [Acidobacteriaceae bacterium]|jgi:glycosyltransferase involved in cell wall biosynthesis